MSYPSAFKTPQGEAEYMAAYDALMKLWPVPFEEVETASRFGRTHVVVSGPANAPPLVLLHGYWATAAMWIPNVEDFCKEYRVYAADVMGQPSKSIPDEPILSAPDYVEWLTATLDGLHLGRVSLAGMSYGGWLALAYAIAEPGRVWKLALLSPAASFLPLVRQFSLRAMLMLLIPARFTVNSFMRWLGIKGAGDKIVELMYLGLKHFRIPQGVMPTVFSDAELQALRVPTLLLIGDDEVIYDPTAALARARRLIPDFKGYLLPRSRHEMCFSQHETVDARVLDFLRTTRTDDRSETTARSAA